MRTLKLLALILVVSVFCPVSNAQKIVSSPAEPFNGVLIFGYEQQINQYNSSVDKLDSVVDDYLTSLNRTTGEWPEFDYKDHKRINPSWMPVLERMRLMTVAYTHPKSKYFKDDSLVRAINKSLYFFTSQQPLPYCDNWYIQGITRPQSLTKSLINMRLSAKGLDDKVEHSLIKAICIDTALHSNGRNNPYHKYNFGANKSQIAKGWVYMGAALGDLHMLETGIKEVYAPIQKTTGEGIQHDLSYDMHYGYLYNGTYGVDFMQSVVEVASLMKGTPYALSGEKLVLFRNFITESIFGLMRGQWMDWNVLGRGISRVDATKRDFSALLKELIAIDPAARTTYEQMIAQIVAKVPNLSINASSHKHYWTTDYTVHKRPQYTFSVHAVSNRNYSQEIGNQENLKGFWGAQGTTNLQLQGDEYYNIFPRWNWARLPGTTLPDTVPVLVDKAPGVGDRKGTSSFSGGVSDSLYGVTAYVVESDLETSYKKSWFMFDKEIVCLGTGVTSSLEVPVYTTLNQCVLKGKVFMKKRGKGKKSEQITQAINDDSIQWLWHDNVGYLFSTVGDTDLQLENRTGNWKDIRMSQRTTKLESGPVFQLAINHGVQPDGASYAYILLPGIKSIKSMNLFVKNNPIEIVSNTEKLQAVYQKKLKIRQMVFYSSTAVYEDDDLRIQTETPVLLMLKKLEEGKYELHAADPTQSKSGVKIAVSFKKNKKVNNITLVFKEKPYAGVSQSVILTD